jgi:site-specific DNA-methyltransferase (adenine-specific)
VTEPYYTGGGVTLYLGDCLEVTEWAAAAVLVTDPPYGRAWRQGELKPAWQKSDRHGGITGDGGTAARDAVLALWGPVRPAVVFGDLMLGPPPGTRLVGVYRKPPNAGTRGAVGGFRRDAEAFYLIGTAWPSGLGGRSSVLVTGARVQGGPVSVQARYGHPHAKPLDVMEVLAAAWPAGTVADPFAGAGSTLVAARNLGREAVGVEIHEPYAEACARRLDQAALFTG